MHIRVKPPYGRISGDMGVLLLHYIYLIQLTLDMVDIIPLSITLYGSFVSSDGARMMLSTLLPANWGRGGVNNVTEF